MGTYAEQSLGFFAAGLPNDFWLTQIEIERGSDDELMIERDSGDRPILSAKGRARESAVSPAAQHREMIANLQTGFPAAQVNHFVDRTSFGVDITFFADEPEVSDAEDESQE